MRLVARTPMNTDKAPLPRLYFVHIPKTAGITLKTFLENNYAHGDSLVIDEWKARQLPPEELRRYRLLSGHYSSEVLDALGVRPDVTLMLVREPIARFRSWAAHCRRLRNSRYRETFEGRTEEEALQSADGYTCLQAHWLARAVRDGANYASVPVVSEINELLNRVNVTGVTEEIERYMQLVSFRMGWPPPPLGWHINRRPEAETGTAMAVDQISDERLRAYLETDQVLYDMALARFWGAYADMLTAIRPDATTFTPESARAVTIELAQDWLRHHHEGQAARRWPAAVESIDIAGDRPIAGEGWWWRERPQTTAYRWTGPEGRSTLLAPPLVEGQHYELVVECMGAADWTTWEQVGLEINGHSVRAVHERFAPHHAGSVAIVTRARLTPEIVAAQNGLTRITITTPATTQALVHVRVEESFDTFHNDARAVGLAVHRVLVRRTAAHSQPLLTLRRTA